jgi:CubicO group peptidase (beta-lactamase class C family)
MSQLKRPDNIIKSISVICFGILFLCSGCTLGRIGLHFLPSVSDFKVFPSDTIRASEKKNIAFNETKNQFLPDIKEWVPEVNIRNAVNNDDFLNKTKTTALLVLKNDTLVYEKYFNGHEKEEPQIVFSVTKGITAMLTAIAMQEGLLKLDQKVSDFIPEFAKDNRKDIEIHHLMNMVSGIDFKDKSDLARLSVLYYQTNQEKYCRNFRRVSHRPGTFFAYNSLSTQILAQCLEKATNRKLKDYLQEKLWQPLGMEYDALFTKDSKRHSNNRAFGGIAMRSRDMIRIGKLLLNKGVWEGKQILPKVFVETLMQRTVSEELWWGYSNCFWRDGYISTNFLLDNDFFAAGYGGQFIYVNPENKMVIVRQGKHESFRWTLLFGRLVAAYNQQGNDLTDPNKNFEEQFEGIYESENGEKYEIIYKGISPETGENQWVIFKDINQTLKTRRLFIAKKFDGNSIGIERFSYLGRAIFNIENDKVVGMHYENQRAVDLRYFTKKSEIPFNLRKTMLAGIKKANDKRVKLYK